MGLLDIPAQPSICRNTSHTHYPVKDTSLNGIKKVKREQSPSPGDTILPHWKEEEILTHLNTSVSLEAVLISLRLKLVDFNINQFKCMLCVVLLYFNSTFKIRNMKFAQNRLFGE